MSDDRRTVSAAQRTGRESTAAKRPGSRKKRRINWFRLAILLFIIILAVTGVIAALLINNPSAKSASGNLSAHKQAVFGIKSIAIEGSSHYSEDDILNASGLYTGESIFSVNKRKAAENILQAFPYVEKVTVDSPSFDKIKIAITEEQPVGVIQVEGGWMIMGQGGKGLELLPDGSDKLDGYLRVKGNIQPDGGLGRKLIDDRSLKIIKTLLDAFNNYGLQNVKEMDLADFTDIELNWNDQITLKMGTDTKLDHEVSVAVSTLSMLLKDKGNDARGVLDLSLYSDTDLNQSIFTPEDLLTTTTAASTAATDAAAE